VALRLIIQRWIAAINRYVCSYRLAIYPKLRIVKFAPQFIIANGLQICTIDLILVIFIVFSQSCWGTQPFEKVFLFIEREKLTLPVVACFGAVYEVVWIYVSCWNVVYSFIESELEIACVCKWEVDASIVAICFNERFVYITENYGLIFKHAAKFKLLFCH